MTTSRRLANALVLLIAFSLLALSCAGGSEDQAANPRTAGDSPARADDAAATPTPGDGVDAGVAADDEPTAPGAADGDTIQLTQSGGLLAIIKARGVLNCGVSDAVIGFSLTQPDGSQQGFDADWCRAVAAAVLGNAEAVNFVVLNAATRFIAIQTGEVDVLMHNTSRTQSRDTDVGMDFGPTTFYDGQQIMGRAGDGFDVLSTVADIGGRVVCTDAVEANGTNLTTAAAAAGVEVTVNTYDNFDTVTANFIAGDCDLITTEGSRLVGRKVEQQPTDQDWVIFPAIPLSKNPIGPIYGPNDSTFADVVNWTVYATIIADENGVTAANVEESAANPANAEIQRLLGGEGELQTLMGLEADAFLQVIKQVGNYDEIFARHLGPLGIDRAGSANARWTEGGLIYAPPAR